MRRGRIDDNRRLGAGLHCGGGCFWRIHFLRCGVQRTGCFQYHERKSRPAVFDDDIDAQSEQFIRLKLGGITLGHSEIFRQVNLQPLHDERPEQRRQVDRERGETGRAVRQRRPGMLQKQTAQPM